MIFFGVGVVMCCVMEVVEVVGYVFVVDLMLFDVLCIGGNVVMNVGGKKVVLWGIVFDNFVWWWMVDLDGNWFEVMCYEYNQGKIYDIVVVCFELKWFDGVYVLGEKLFKSEMFEIEGCWFCKEGFGKDVIDKFFVGLLGVQKEGCDGFIMFVCWVLYKMFVYMCIVCFEFFGQVCEVILSIVEIKDYLFEMLKQGGVIFVGFEYFDECYLCVVGYVIKSKCNVFLKMVLIGDIVGDDVDVVVYVMFEVIWMVNGKSGEGFVVVSVEVCKCFWFDCSCMVVIVKYMNVFKINEDVVILLNWMGEYIDGIEWINIELLLKNKLQLVDVFEVFFCGGNLLFGKIDDVNEILSVELFEDCVQQVLELFKCVCVCWEFVCDWFDQLLCEVQYYLVQFGYEVFVEKFVDCVDEQLGVIVFYIMQDCMVCILWKQEICVELCVIFNGGVFKQIFDEVQVIYKCVLCGCVFVVLYMYVGDGNVYINILVNFDNYEMLQDVYVLVVCIMMFVCLFDGVIFGEYGIGIMKFEFLIDDEIVEFCVYKQCVDLNGCFNKGKLFDGVDLCNVYMLSFGLMGYELLIMQQFDIGVIVDLVKDCLCCGKCKLVCVIYVLCVNLLYSLCNKIFVMLFLVEVFLYEEQMCCGVLIKYWDEFNDVVDYCMVCYKCVMLCLVKIDFGDVMMNMCNLLCKMGKKKFNVGNVVGMFFLNVINLQMINVVCGVMMGVGYKVQCFVNDMLKKVVMKQMQYLFVMIGKLLVVEQVIYFVNKKMLGNLLKKMVCVLLDIEDNKIVLIICNLKLMIVDLEVVFYFLGCGFECLFLQVGLVMQVMLWEVGVQMVLLLGYLCCGYLQCGLGQYDKVEKIVMDNCVLFYCVVNMLNYFDIKMVVVLCGICYDQFVGYEFDKIFLGCWIIDIYEFLFEKGMKFDGVMGMCYMYYDLCYMLIKMIDLVKLVNELMGLEKDGYKIEKNDCCCGELGMLVVMWLDILMQVCFCKEEEICKGVVKLCVILVVVGDVLVLVVVVVNGLDVKILMSCLLCLQGLLCYSEDVNFEVDYIVVEIVCQVFGENWMVDYVVCVNYGGIECVLV